MDLLPCVDDDIEGIVRRGLTAATRDDAHQESYEDDSAHVESVSFGICKCMLFRAAIVAPNQLLQRTARSARVHSPSTPIRLPSAPESLSR
jgi:hypothetical protein